MKAYTDLEQSKKLAEILPLQSADMFYEYVLPKSDKIKHNPEIGNPINALEWYNKGYTLSGKEPITLDEYCVPCWSLAALLSAIPNASLPRNVLGWQCISYKNCICTKGDIADDPVDACVEMIIRLNELNLL